MDPNSPSNRRSRRRKSTLYTNPEPYFFLPPEILTEILARLPVKSLLRFRCVSKSWCALISSPQFAKLHLNLSSSRKGYDHHKILSVVFELQCSLKECSLQSVLSKPVTEAVEVDCPMKSACDAVGFVGSCNGLLCVAIEYERLFIWNPTTGKFKKVPDYRAEMFYVCTSKYGFGYDELNDDYKVVGTCEIDDMVYEVMVYSLRSDSWRRVGDFKGGVLAKDEGKYVNGKIHWEVCHFIGNRRSGWEIVSLDLAKEVYGKVEQPDYGETTSYLTMGAVCGYLCVLCWYERGYIEMDLWVMREYGVNESWTKMVTLPTSLYGVWSKTFSSPFCITKNGEVLMVVGSEIIVDDPKNILFPKITNFGKIYEGEIYVESLVSPIADSEAGREQQQ